jgi:hypothetical protein
VRVFALALIAISAAGYAVRRNCGLNWILVVLTIEGCMRVAALAPLSELAWMRV